MKTSVGVYHYPDSEPKIIVAEEDNITDHEKYSELIGKVAQAIGKENNR